MPKMTWGGQEAIFVVSKRVKTTNQQRLDPIYIAPIGTKIDMAAYSFGSEHSAQWAWNMQKKHAFYTNLLIQVNNFQP